MWDIILPCLAVCAAKILEISISSIKTVCMVKGERKLAACLAFIECLVWGLVVSSVIATLNSNYYMLFSYCFGYACGLYLGSLIEAKIALGTSSVQIIVSKEHTESVENLLKSNNHGYTVLDGHGAKNEQCVIIMILPRKEVKPVMKEIRNICNKEVFMISSEVSKFVGGYGVRK